MVDLISVFSEILFDKHGVGIKHIKNFVMETENDLPWSEIEKCFQLTYARWKDFPILPGISDFLQELYYSGDSDPIRIITHRPAYICANDTYKLCERLGVPFELIITGNQQSMIPGQPDVDKFNYLNRYRFFVDDRRKTAINLSQKGKYVFMPKKVYNELDDDYKNLEPINSVADLHDRMYWFITEV